MIEVNKYTDKINAAPLGCFSEITSKRDRISVGFKFDTSLYTEDFEFKSSKKFSLFEMGGITSLNVMFMYVFTFPFKTFNLYDKYLIIRRPSSKSLSNFSGVELVYQSKYINVYNSEDGACLISANGLNQVILNEIVRKSKKVK